MTDRQVRLPTRRVWRWPVTVAFRRPFVREYVRVPNNEWFGCGACYAPPGMKHEPDCVNYLIALREGH